MGRNRVLSRNVVIYILIAAVFLLIGFIIGSAITLHYAVLMADNFLNITINEKALAKALSLYGNHLVSFQQMYGNLLINSTLIPTTENLKL